ncbi:MAG: fibronectin type III domain-containing protein [Ruminiclostridium sp.]|nr:fibronectin type III domain-containing protein [Ruminiclostridium sp.]
MKKKKILGALLAVAMAFTGVPAAVLPLNTQVSAATATATASVTTKLAAPKNFKATVTGTTVKLTWKKVKGADAYRIYKLNDSTKKYETFKNVTGTSLTIKSLKAGKYKYKIAALVKKGSSYTVQTKSSPITATVKSSSSTEEKTASLPVTFPAFGTAKADVIKTMALTEGYDAGKVKDDVYAYGGYKKINGTECMILLYFTESGKFFYGAALLPSSAFKLSTLYSDIKSVKGKPDINMENKGVKLYEWLDNKNESLICLVGSESSDKIMYMAMSKKYAPASVSESSDTDFAAAFEMLG